jgi:hypothetical protein
LKDARWVIETDEELADVIPREGVESIASALFGYSFLW